MIGTSGSGGATSPAIVLGGAGMRGEGGGGKRIGGDGGSKGATFGSIIGAPLTSVVTVAVTCGRPGAVATAVLMSVVPAAAGVGRIEIVIVTVCPGASVPIVQTSDTVPLHVPSVVVADTSSVLGGRVSVTITPSTGIVFGLVTVTE